MDLHINYEQAEKYDLKRSEQEAVATGKNAAILDVEINPASTARGSDKSKPKLKADKENSVIFIDSNTTLPGATQIAWEYKLLNRSALEWILDQ